MCFGGVLGGGGGGGGGKEEKSLTSSYCALARVSRKKKGRAKTVATVLLLFLRERENGEHAHVWRNRPQRRKVGVERAGVSTSGRKNVSLCSMRTRRSAGEKRAARCSPLRLPPPIRGKGKGGGGLYLPLHLGEREGGGKGEVRIGLFMS